MLLSSQNYLSNAFNYTTYPHEIINSFFKSENRNIPIRMQSDQLAIRPELVKMMQKFSRQCQFNLATFSLGVYILDAYMDSYIISASREHQKLVALVCLLLAAKSEDIDVQIPSIKVLLSIVNLKDDLKVDFHPSQLRNYNTKQIQHAYKQFSWMYSKLEFLIFSAMEFNLMRPTCVSFLNFLQPVMVTELDYETLSDDKFGSLANMRIAARDQVYPLLEIVIGDVNFFNVLPSRVAAGVIATIRTILDLRHVWNDEMELHTRYKFAEVRSIVNYLLRKMGRISSTSTPCNTSRLDDEDESGFISASDIDPNESTEWPYGNHSLILCEDEEIEQDKKRARLNTSLDEA